MTLPSLDFRDPALASRLMEGSLVVSASAGSGKTFALVTLVLGFLGRGGRASEVVATTFGREAAADLRARLLEPLDQLAALDLDAWAEALGALKAGGAAWDAWIARRALRGELGASAQQWVRQEEWPSWAASAQKARIHWIRTRREAELLRATTVHALAQALLKARGLGAEALLEADDPTLVRLLRAAGRQILDLPADHPDQAAARRLWAWCEGREEDQDRWSLLATAFDGHLDALGTWRSSLDAAIPRGRFLREGRSLLEAYGAFAQEPLRAAALTKQGKPHGSFLRYGLAKLQPEATGSATPARILGALERLGTRCLKEDGTVPNYFAEGFAEALAPLRDDLPGQLETWMTLLLEGVFQRFRSLKAERSLHSYGDLVREALETLRAAPLAQAPALLLVDEYQDTNPLQEAFLEALQAHRTVLVGDPKQAIYGFRGGVPELLKRKLRMAGAAFRLPVNHRSSAPVVAVANAFVAEVVPRLDPASFDPDGTQEHRGNGEGTALVALAGIPSAKRGSDLAAASAWIASLARPAGWTAAGFPELPSRRRALLLPRRTGLAALRRALQAAHIEPLVQSREGFWESPGVRLLMTLLEALARPEAEVACFAVLRSPWCGAPNPELLAFAASGVRSQAVEEGLAWLAALGRQSTQALMAEAVMRPGLLELLAATAAQGALEPARARRNLERFLGWIPGLPPVPALAWAKLQRLRAFRDPGDAPAEDAAVDLVVQTIHGAKGLEYDDVILPLLANPVKGVRKGTIRQRPSAPGVLWMGWKLGRARGPALRELHGDEARRVFREGLNLLYVGLTRARNRMALLQQWPDGEPPPSGVERLAEDKSVQWHHVGSDLTSSLPQLPLLAEAPGAAPALVPAAARLLPPAAVRLPLGPARIGVSSDGDRVRQGLRIHALLREVLVRDAVDPAAARAYLADHPVVKDWPQAQGLVEAVLRELASRGWERLPRRTELELTGAGQAGGGGRADLVLWAPDRRNPVSLHLVDFKLAASFPPETLDLHRLQLAGYRAALQDLHPGTAIEAWVVGLEGGGWVKLIGAED
jgi:superfamily I DNA/RNA helicase